VRLPEVKVKQLLQCKMFISFLHKEALQYYILLILHVNYLGTVGFEWIKNKEKHIRQNYYCSK
jgi:hypothetical protein